MSDFLRASLQLKTQPDDGCISVFLGLLPYLFATSVEVLYMTWFEPAEIIFIGANN